MPVKDSGCDDPSGSSPACRWGSIDDERVRPPIVWYRPHHIRGSGEYPCWRGLSRVG
jgi:hypothetical protein